VNDIVGDLNREPLSRPESMDAIDAEPAKRNAPVNEQSRRMESVKRGVIDRLLSSSRYVSLAAALALALVHAPTARAGQAFDGPQAGGATLGAALVAGIVCWTVELGTQDRYRFDEVVEERDDDYGRVGWYGQLNALYALEVIDEGKEEVGMAESVAPEPVDFKLDSRHSGGIRAAAGRRCHERFAVEVDVDWIAPYKGDLDSENSGKLQDVEYEIVSATINAKGYLLTGRVQPYVLLGIGTLVVMTTNDPVSLGPTRQKETGQLAVRGGGGVDFYVDRNWVLNLGADYLWAATNLDHFDFFSVTAGVQYRW